jgi:hypothetical protein
MAISNALGLRPLGVAASELAAVARMVSAQQVGGPQDLVAVGPQVSLTALVAAVLEPAAVGTLDLTNSVSSLVRLIDPNVSVYSVANVWTFGLLSEADIPDLKALVAPRPITER